MAQRPPQQQGRQPGRESEMVPRPRSDRPEQAGCGRLAGKVALITGGDSGIGRAVAVAFAKEGADIAIGYLDEHEDARETLEQVRSQGGRCIAVPGDIGDEGFCGELVGQTVKQLGKLDILVNNAAEQHVQKEITGISSEQLERTFRTNIFSMFYLTKAALPHLKSGSSIINTASITAYKGQPTLIDYSSTKGAIVPFTRSLVYCVTNIGTFRAPLRGWDKARRAGKGGSLAKRRNAGTASQGGSRRATR